MPKPSVLVVSSCEISPESIIEKVLNSDLPEIVTIDENISAFPWQIDNKYYTADVLLCSVASKSISNQQFGTTVEAVILVFDAKSEKGLDAAESWLSFLHVYDADIKILVCKTCLDEDAPGSNGVKKRSAQEWCIQRGFELVELEPNLDDVDPDDDFPETTGVERIRQALNANQWANLKLKVNNSRVAAETANDSISDALAESLEELLEGDDFADLFSQLSEMKSRVATLSGSARKDAAEQVVRAFMNAMGGDDDEL